MGNADDDAELTSDWRSHQPAPRHPAAPQQSAPPQGWVAPPSPPWQPQQTYGSPPPAGPPPFPTHPASWAAAPPSGPPPGSWPGAGFGATPPPSKKSPVLAIVAVVVVVMVAVAGAALYVLRDYGDDTKTAAEPTSGPETAAPGGGARESASPSKTASAPSTQSAGPTASQGTLASLLSSASDLAKFANGDAMTPSAVVSDPFSGFTVDPSSCAAAVAPGAFSSYNGSGYTAFAGQAANDASEQHKIIQAVASFPTPAEAQSFYDTQVAAWRGCKYTTVTLTVTVGEGSTSQAKSGTVGESDGTANLLLFRSGPNGRDCQRGLTVRNNIIVDVRVCSPNVGGGGWQLARDIGQRITGKR